MAKTNTADIGFEKEIIQPTLALKKKYGKLQIC